MIHAGSRWPCGGVGRWCSSGGAALALLAVVLWSAVVVQGSEGAPSGHQHQRHIQRADRQAGSFVDVSSQDQQIDEAAAQQHHHARQQQDGVAAQSGRQYGGDDSDDSGWSKPILTVSDSRSPGGGGGIVRDEDGLGVGVGGWESTRVHSVHHDDTDSTHDKVDSVVRTADHIVNAPPESIRSHARPPYPPQQPALAGGPALRQGEEEEEGEPPYHPPHPPEAYRAEPDGPAAEGGHLQRAATMADVYFLMVVAGCSVAGLVGLVVAGVCWYRLQKNVKAASEAEYPAYGVTGPSKERVPSPGDRKLAQSAQMYHYQHQKQQMLALEKANNEMKQEASDDDSEEENIEGDYTVYECPGLATTGEMELKNPLFEETPVNPAAPPNGAGSNNQQDTADK